MSGGDRRRAIIDATLEALRHTVGRDEHMPFLKQLVEGQIGPVTFAEIADGLASIDNTLQTIALTCAGVQAWGGPEISGGRPAACLRQMFHRPIDVGGFQPCPRCLRPGANYDEGPSFPRAASPPRLHPPAQPSLPSCRR